MMSLWLRRRSGASPSNCHGRQASKLEHLDLCADVPHGFHMFPSLESLEDKLQQFLKV